VAPEALEYFAAKRQEWKKTRTEWQSLFEAWSRANPDKRAEWDAYFSAAPKSFTAPSFTLGEKIATRTASNKVLVEAARGIPNLVGGSADLQSPNAVALPEVGVFSPANRNGRYIHFGIREFGMAAISNGIQLHGGLRAFCATFLVFADYLRPALRLSALMKQPVIYVLTHDSIYIGEDGPTHQPVEHLASLRAIPNVRVLRPADAEETALAWTMALERTDGPTVLALTRQNVPVFAKADPDWRETIRTGAYIVKKSSGTPDVVLIATGSEVSLALAAAEKIQGKQVQVVSMISRELFEQQPEAVQNAIVPSGVRRVVVEAGSRMGWEGWAKREDILSVDRFGESGPGDKVAEHLGFTVDALVSIINRA
jgi:transketolase